MPKLRDLYKQNYYSITLKNGEQLEGKVIDFYYDHCLAFQISENHQFKIIEIPFKQIESYEEIGDFEHYCQWKGWDDEFKINTPIDYES